MQERNYKPSRGGHFPIFGDGAETFVKAIVLIGDKVVGKAIVNRAYIGNEGKLGVWGLALRKGY